MLHESRDRVIIAMYISHVWTILPKIKEKIEERDKKQSGDSKVNEQFDKNWIINKYGHLLNECERTTPSFQDYQPVGYRGRIHSVFSSSTVI